jgi:hypothetical protein
MKLWFAGLLRRVMWWLDTKISEDRTSALKMEAARSFETLASNYNTTRRNNQENHKSNL